MDESPVKQSLVGRLRDFFFRPSSLSLIAVVAIGMVSGLVFWGGFNTGMEATNSLAFCVSCHEMRDTVFQEYKETIHYKNRSGVRAVCSDCHVPKDWGHKFVRKVQASQELYGKFVTGAIDTPEKFESKRMELAQHVWADDEGKRLPRMPQLPLLGGHGSARSSIRAGARRWRRRRRRARRASIATRAWRTSCPRNSRRTRKNDVPMQADVNRGRR